MNKKITIFLSLLCSGIFLAQDVHPTTSPVKEGDLKDTAIITVCYDYPDHKALFLNGKEDFVEKLKNTISLDGLKLLKDEDNFKSTLEFIVEKDGTISEIQVWGSNKKFNKAVKLAAKQIKGKWTPAKKDGNLVKNIMQIPIVMNSH